MRDVQQEKPEIEQLLPFVGITQLYHPVYVYVCGLDEEVFTPAEFTIFTSVPSSMRGTHMSRLVEAVSDTFNRKRFVTVGVRELLQCASESLGTDSCAARVSFKYFVDKVAPVSEIHQWMDVDVKVLGVLDNDVMRLAVGVSVPYMSLCPCSKEISEANAHNQRSRADVIVLVDDIENPPMFEELVDLVDKNASCFIRPLLKRVDEKYVTEHAYERPRFVEDMARLLSRDLSERYQSFWVRVTHFESIHNHNAVALCFSDGFDDWMIVTLILNF